MATTLLLGFLAGVWFGNGVPHFVRGITRQSYPSMFGSGPVPNLIAGWLALATSPLLVYWAKPEQHPLAFWIAAASGVLAIGLFHAGPGAFGRKS